MLGRLATTMDSYRHIVISLTTLGAQGQTLVAKGVEVYPLNMRHQFDFLSLISLWRLIRKIRPEIIQTWMYHSDLLGGIAGRLAGVKNIVWNIRNTDVPQSGFSLTGLVIRFCAVASYWLPNRIVCCAYAALEKHASLGYCRQRMVVIGNGYLIESAQLPEFGKEAIRKNLGFPLEAIVVGIVGRYDTLKGYDIFVKAAGLLAERYTGRLLFLMIGRNVTEDNSELTQKIIQFGGRSKFKLLGERRDINNIMSALDIYCLASRAEGFPNVVAEAMLMQVPCVVSDVGDAKLIVGPTGIVVPPEDPAMLANAIYSMIEMTPDCRKNMGHAARQRIVENFDIKSVANQYSEVYQSLE